MRSSRFSRSSSFSRARSSIVSSSLTGCSARYFDTQFPSVASWIPRSRATAAIGRLESSTTRTASSRYSAVNFRYFPIMTFPSGNKSPIQGHYPNGGTHLTRREGLGKETVRRWVVQAQVDGGQRQGATSEELAEIKELKAKVRRLEEDNEILRRASIFFVGELDPRNR